MEDWNAYGHGTKIDRRAADWGLVSFGLSAVFLIMSPIQLTFNVVYWVFGVRNHFKQELDIARIVAPLVTLMFLGLLVFALFAAFRGMALARLTQNPIALPLAGMLMSIVGIIVWIGLSLNLVAILGVFQ